MAARGSTWRSLAWWRDLVREVRDAIARDNVVLLAAGVAFFALLAIVPGLAAMVAIWGLVAEPSDVTSVVDNLASSLPPSAQQTIEEQLRSVAESSRAGLGVTAVAGILVSLWSASTATKHLFQAVRTASGDPGRASYVRQRGLALAFTGGTIVFGLVAVALIAIVPASLASTEVGRAVRVAVAWLRWPLLALSMMLALTVVYRVAPRRHPPGWQFASAGALAATFVWLMGSAGFAWYAASFGSFNRTYGSMAGVIVLMLWLFLSAFVVILGAETNTVIDHLRRSPNTADGAGGARPR